MVASIIKQSADTHKKIILFAFILLIFIHIIFVFSGLYGNDDINYARYAADIAYHGISFSPAHDHYQLRWTTNFATAYFYRFFGINAFTSALSSFISVALCGILLYKILHKKTTTEYLLAMTLFFLGHSIIFYTHRLLPDPVMCFAVLLMYYIYRSVLLKVTNTLLLGFTFAVALFLAIITKETILIALPLFVVFFLKDVFKKKHLSFWKYAISFSSLFIFLYLLYFKITTGDFLYRYHLLIAKSYVNECSFDLLPFIVTLNRIGYYLWRAMLLNGDLLVILPAAAAVIYRKRILLENVQRTDAFSFFVLLCCANFMTISFKAYTPLCHDPRHFIFLMPFAAIIGGPMLNAYFKNPLKFIALPLLFIAATGAIFIIQGGTTKYLYLLITLLLSSRYIFYKIKANGWLYKISFIAFIAIFSINYFIDFLKPMYPFYWDHKKMIEKTFIGKTDTATIFSPDIFSAELSEYFLKFKTKNLRFLPIDSAKTSSQGQVYYLLSSVLHTSAKNKMDSLINKNPGLDISIYAKEKNVYLYKLSNASLLLIKDQH